MQRSDPVLSLRPPCDQPVCSHLHRLKLGLAGNEQGIRTNPLCKTRMPCGLTRWRATGTSKGVLREHVIKAHTGKVPMTNRTTRRRIRSALLSNVGAK